METGRKAVRFVNDAHGTNQTLRVLFARRQVDGPIIGWLTETQAQRLEKTCTSGSGCYFGCFERVHVAEGEPYRMEGWPFMPHLVEAAVEGADARPA